MALKIKPLNVKEAVKKPVVEKPKPKPVEKPKKEETEEIEVTLYDILPVNHIEWELIEYTISGDEVLDRKVIRTDVKDLVLRQLQAIYRSKVYLN